MLLGRLLYRPLTNRSAVVEPTPRSTSMAIALFRPFFATHFSTAFNNAASVAVLIELKNTRNPVLAKAKSHGTPYFYTVLRELESKP